MVIVEASIVRLACPKNTNENASIYGPGNNCKTRLGQHSNGPKAKPAEEFIQGSRTAGIRASMMIIAGIAAAAAVCHGFIASFEFQWHIRLHHDELRAKARFI